MAWTVTHEDLFKKINREMDAYAQSMWRRSGNEVYDRRMRSPPCICAITSWWVTSARIPRRAGAASAGEKPLEAVCRRWMSELKYDPRESFDRAIRSYGNPEESEMSIGMSGPTMG